MANIQVRNLGDASDSDLSPWNLPINAFDFALNARFDEGKVKKEQLYLNL